ncbi:MAG: GIY-YIG nuclease family protein [Planctomycetota bacterium]|nr:GIY-YIG nuclease family protein [Planctomycetota bacterium]
MTTRILLNELLNLRDLHNVKVRFNKPSQAGWNPIELFKNGDITALLQGQYWNYSISSFQVGQITVGLIRLDQPDLWLLFHVGRVKKSLGVVNGVGYEHEDLPEYDKYLGRIIVRYKNKSQNMIRKAESVLDECEVCQILPDIFDNDIFPGYENVDLSWRDLDRVLRKPVWRTALENQKGIYLIVDSSNGKMYVGSAYGENMILGRWLAYAKNGHGGNIELRNLDAAHIQHFFRYSILDIYKSTANDTAILARESWWKRVLMTRTYGYNSN